MRGRSAPKNSGIFLSTETKKALRWAISVTPQTLESRPITALLDKLGDKWDDPEVHIPAAQRAFLKKVVYSAVQLKDVDSLSEDHLKHYDQFRYFCTHNL